MRHVYERGIKDADVIEDADMWREVLRIINDATVEGLMQSHVPTLEDNFLRELRHGNEVFSAFKVHAMDKEMQRLLIDESGKLKPFSKWRDDVEKIASHQCGAWLRTEYDTAVIRAHNAADWKEYERDKDIMPNLRWMPTTSGEPEAKHRSYWLRRVNLPVDHPFWNEHHPGDRWNCKCTLEQNDEPIVLPPSDGSDSGATPHQGLENNPGKDGHIYNDTHPYFPKSCNECAAYRAGGLKNRLKLLFLNRKKDCYNCPYIVGCIDRKEAKKSIDEAAYKKKQEVKEKNLMPAQPDRNYTNLTTGNIHQTGKARNRLLSHLHHDYDVDAAVYIWEHLEELIFVRISRLGEGKDMTKQKNINNIQNKRERGVVEYAVYRFTHNGRTFLAKTEKLRFGKEQLYSLHEE